MEIKSALTGQSEPAYGLTRSATEEKKSGQTNENRNLHRLYSSPSHDKWITFYFHYHNFPLRCKGSFP